MNWALALLVAPSVALADPFCESLSDFAAQAMGDGPPQFDLADVAAEPACTRTLELGGIRAVTCGWAYSYRSESASAAFEALLSAVAACGEAVGRDEALVSHPDSYDLRLFRVGAAEVSVSLKDKGALEQTWLFLRAGSN